MENNLQELIKKAQSGDSQSLGKIYEEYVDRIYRFIYVRVNHKQTAEDLTSDIFFKAFRSIESFRINTGNFTAWMYTIARNQVTDHYRRNRTTEDLSHAENMAGNESVAKDVENRMMLEKVNELIKQLPEKDQEIILLRVWDGLSHAEIAHILNSTENAVKVGYLRAMRKLKAVEVLALLLLIVQVYE